MVPPELPSHTAEILGVYVTGKGGFGQNYDFKSRKSMSFCFINLSTQEIDLRVNSWNWKTTVAIIQSLDILEDETIDLISSACLWGEISKSEARIIADRIEADYLSRMPEGARVTIDLSITQEEDDGRLYVGEEIWKNYSATRKWLVEFCDYCRRTDGFSVG